MVCERCALLNEKSERLLASARAHGTMALAAVLDDDDLLRCICEVGDQQFLRTARLISKRLRTAATDVISVRLVSAPPSNVNVELHKYRNVHAYIHGKINAHDSELEPVVVEEHHSIAKYVRLFESGCCHPMVVQDDSSPTVRMQRALSFIDHLRSHGILRPFIIITPVPAEWQHAIEMIVPHIPSS